MQLHLFTVNLQLKFRPQRLSCQNILYGDQATVERYLEEAEALDAAMIVICARHDALDARLAEIAQRRIVFSVIEPSQAKNTFFIGSNKRIDSRLLAEKCREHHPHARHILLIGKDIERYQSFAETFGTPTLTHISPESTQSAASLAREIDVIRQKQGIDLAVCLDGTTSRLCLALKKLNLNVLIYGFEAAPNDDRYYAPAGEVCQNTDEIVKTVVVLIEQYLACGMLPDSKNTYIPSSYIAKNQIDQ